MSYDPSEPRDALGRWVADAGALASGAFHGAVEGAKLGAISSVSSAGVNRVLGNGVDLRSSLAGVAVSAVIGSFHGAVTNLAVSREHRTRQIQEHMAAQHSRERNT